MFYIHIFYKADIINIAPVPREAKLAVFCDTKSNS